MNTVFWIVIAVVAVLVPSSRSRRGRTRSRGAGRRFATSSAASTTARSTRPDSRRKAERELEEREKAHESLDIQPLSEAARDRYVDDWQQAERRFVDDPELAAREADRIVRSVLDDRGYPNDDFDTQAAAVSVDHPNVVDALSPRPRDAARQRRRKGKSKGAGNEERTENLRKAMVDFRAVFEQLVEPTGGTGRALSRPSVT